MSPEAAAQSRTSNMTEGSTPAGLAQGVPAGSYALSGFDNVNLYGGHLNLTLPLLRVGGRGEAGYTMTLAVEGISWRVQHLEFYDPAASNGLPFQHYALTSNWWKGPRPGLGPGVVVGRRSGKLNYQPSPISGLPFRSGCQTLTRLYFIAPDGTETMLRDVGLDGAPSPPRGDGSPGFVRGKVFRSADGTAMTFVADANVTDATCVDLEHLDSTEFVTYSGYLMTRDGMRLQLDSRGRVEWMRDRNGNRVIFEYSADTNNAAAHGKLIKVTDSVGRVVNISYSAGLTEVSFQGLGGTPRKIIIREDDLPNPGVLRDGQTPKTGRELFPEVYARQAAGSSVSGGGTFGKVTHSVELPDTRKYLFRYNSYGELARVELPTGGAYEYDYSGVYDPDFVEGSGGSGVGRSGEITVWRGNIPDFIIMRRVTRRRVYASAAGPYEHERRYSWFLGSQSGDFSQHRTEVWERQFAPDETLLSHTKHYFHGEPVSSTLSSSGITYPGWREGREYRTEEFDLSATPRLLRSTDVTWEQRIPEYSRPHETRMTQSVTTLADANVVRKQTFAYDDFNNQTEVREYDFGISGALLRRTVTSYLHQTNAAYATDTNVHLRGLVSQVSVKDGAGKERSRLTYEYDNYTPDPENGNRHAALVPYGEIYGLCLKLGGPPSFNCETPAAASYKTRGNVTGITAYLLDGNGNVTGSVTTSRQYDVAGNALKSVDPVGRASNVGFADSFCNDGVRCGGTFQPHTFAFPSSATTPAPDPTGTHGSTSPLSSAVVYDFYTGLAYSATDANNQTTRLEYDDPLDRPTAQIRPDGGRTDMIYHDEAGDIHVTKLVDLDETRRVESRQYFDGLGRPTRQYSHDGSAPDRAWVATKNTYDPLGRMRQVSNPLFRTSLDDFDMPAGGVTTTQYDPLGRIRAVTAADGSVVTTSYDGVTVTATDQVGRVRTSVSDALGRVVKIVEAPEVQGYGYETAHQYDLLGNLRLVTQGKPGQTQQTRTFTYDSLSRLTAATSPESGTIAYEYDAARNLRKRIDARQVQTKYEYDALNRITAQTYAVVEGQPVPTGFVATPAVNYFYDGKGMPLENGQPLPTPDNAAGRVTAVKSSVSETIYTKYDAMGRVMRHRQIADPVSTGAQTYLMEYVYDLGGNLISQKYPSGRVVVTEHDDAGRAAGVKNQATGAYYAGAAAADAVNRIKYAAHGSTEALRLGNGLWEHTGFNNRLQPIEVGLGTSPADSGQLRLTYGYGAAGQNDGNVRSQRVQAGGHLDLTQTYEYDAVNRLRAAREAPTAGGAASWLQTYTYLDAGGLNGQFGNRRLDTNTDPATGQPRTTGNVTPQFNPLIDPASNRYAANQGYAYDNVGNLTAAPGAAYRYDAESRLAVLGGGAAGGGADYLYDAHGRRVKKVLPAETTLFVYDVSGRLVAEYSNHSALSGTSYLTHDHPGSTRAVSGADGQVRSRHDFLPFGEEVPAGVGGRGAVPAPGYHTGNVKQKFTTYEREAESGLDYAQHRYYAAAAGRFTTPDPTLLSVSAFNPQTWNRYAYVTNSPLVYADPLGLWRVGYIWTFEKNKDGTDNTDKVKSVQVFLIAEEGDNADTLASALNISKDEAQKIYGRMDEEGKIRGKDIGGKIGTVFGSVEKHLKDWIGDVIKYGHGERANTARKQDCSSASADICLGQSIQGTITVDAELLKGAASPLDSEKELQTGDLVRYAKNGPAAEHFAVFMFFDRQGVPWVFSKSGKEGPYEFDPAPKIGERYGYGDIKPVRGLGKTGYYRKNFAYGKLQ
jgi:RHS repeat-associated protein